ncbi:hypothetical protein EYZ11_003714 [Aspergillus tanneri]|uniref:Nuclear pore complex subunit Nup192 n=1 Tax=Aspergillus tanneri TaxID=1220188 RepID=A0A4S3JMC5_9EURO|nr:hypothetical protein EYZ11_003714 [Aspergillus tanneri]
MEDQDTLAGLRGLYQDLSALSNSSFVNIERLRIELEAHIQDFRKLLDKPTKNNASRQAVLSGKITVDEIQYSINEEFQQGALQLADALNIDELEAAVLFLNAQEDAQSLDRSPLIAAIMRFHERRHFLLESLRLIFQESFEVERETDQVLMQEILAFVVEIKDGPLRNASLFTRKCMTSMEDIEKWLSLLSEQIQKVSIVGQSEDLDIMEAIEYQRSSLQQQHESLGAILCYLFKGPGWDFDGPSSPIPGVDFGKEAEERTKMFMSALDDGALDFMLAICSGVNDEEWADPARSELVALLLKESASSFLEDSCSGYFKTLLMGNYEVFAESCIANMPDAVRMLKSEEDSQRLDQITALRDGLTSSLHRGLVEARTHLETFLVIMAFSFEHRPDAAQEFWADPDGNLYGFLQWASKRQTVPRVSAFCELMFSISGGEDNAAAAYRFLSEEDKFVASKFKRSTSMNWSQMFAELQLYATRVTEKPPSASHAILRARKSEPSDMSEPESPVMLTCYLRLIGHLCRESATIREWMLHHPTFSIVTTLLTLSSGPIPTHLRATVFTTLSALMTGRTSFNGNEMWLSIDQWISGGSMSTSGLGKVPLASNPLVWHEQQAFQKIGESFDQANAFVGLIYSLVSPTADLEANHLALPFPESLGSSYRMPGIEPYIDFVMGQALSRKVPDLNERQVRLLTYNCLNFVVTCLKLFNENIVTVLSQPPASSDSTPKTSSLLTYVRLHPFARVAEWLFNEEVIKSIFATAHQDVTDVAKAAGDSVLVLSLVRSLEVMDLMMDLQSTYFNIVRPLIVSQPGGSRNNVANSALAAFEDNILNNLTIIPALCLYCSTGHEQLTVTSMALLEKLSSSKKLNKVSSPELAKWRSSNKIIEVLSSEVDVDSVSRPLVSQMQPDLRELDFGAKSSGYIIRESLLALLNSCLGMITDQPTVAHLLLGFSSVGNTLDVPSDGLFSRGASLLHAIIGFLQSYPDEADGNILPWMVHLKRMALEVLKHLWSSKLSSYFTLSEMRSYNFLPNTLTSQPIVGLHTPWDGLPIVTEEFWVSNSTTALAEFLLYRSYLYGYAATEIRSATKLGSPTLQAHIISTLLGNSAVEIGDCIPTPTVFDLFDFVDLDIRHPLQPPVLRLLDGINVDVCAKPRADDSLVIYNLAELEELIQVKKEDLAANGQLRPQDEEHFVAEAENLTLFIQSVNQFRQINYNRYLALRSWTELITTMLTCSGLDGGRKSTFILHSIQLILPKLDAAVEDDTLEAVELARLAETLVSELDSTATDGTLARRSGDVIDEKLHQLFQICVRGIILATGNTNLRETFYNICSHYIARIISPDTAQGSMKQHSQQVIKTAGPALIEAVCDDAYAALDKQEDSTLAELISQSNYLSLFLDAIRTLHVELKNTQASVRDSQLFAADPDLGIDIDNPEALRKYYDLLHLVLRVIVSAVFSRGLHNEQMMEQTRAFLTENRQSMVGVFKRVGKIGGRGAADHHVALSDVAKSYMALIAATDFLEFEENEVEEDLGPRLFS